MNKEIEKLIKIQSRINKNKFHLCISANLEDDYKWVLFLYNPNFDDYLSTYNRPIFDSNKTTIEELDELLKNTKRRK